MGLEDVGRALRARLQLIGVLVLVGLALAAGLAALKTPQYESTAQVNIKGPTSVNDQTGQIAALSQLPTVIKIIPSEDYLRQATAALKLKATPEELKDRVSVSNSAGTSLLDITVADPSASRATAIANRLAAAFDDYLPDVNLGTLRSSQTSTATQPDSPTSPKLWLWLAIGGFLGLAIGTGIALTRGALDRTVREDDDLADLFGLTTLGVVPFDPKAKRQPLPVASPGSGPRAEALRQLRTNLQFLHLGDDVDPPHSILVTSSVGGEGKTTTACNVAIALSRAGLSTILVGADLRRTELAGYMGLSSEVGLTSVLAGWSRLEEALQPWGDEGEQLWVIGSGPTPPNPSELLASEQMQSLLRDLESRADIVVVDGAPLLPVADSAALAAIVSGTLLVIAADRTERDQVTRALGILAGIDAQVYGGVINMARSGRTVAEGKGYLPPESRASR